MFERIAITLPGELGKAVESFLGLEDDYERKTLEKYGPIYETLQKENRKLVKEIMTLAKKSLPPD